MTDITMNLNDTLELDAIIEEWKDSNKVLDLNGDESSFNISGIQTKKSILDPQETGNYTITINGQELSVEVTDTSTIPDDGLVHRYDATKISGSDGDSIGTWTDVSGSDDLIQSDSSRQPTLKTSVINGNQVVRIQNQSNNHYLDTGAISAISSGWTVYVVGQFSSTGGGITNAFGGLEDGGGNPYFGENNQQWALNSGGSEIRGSSEDTNPHIWGFKLTSTADGTLRLDGSDDVTGSITDDNIDAVTLGARGSDDYGSDWDAGEVLVYNKHLSSSEDSDVESYLSDKWGITV